MANAPNPYVVAASKGLTAGASVAEKVCKALDLAKKIRGTYHQVAPYLKAFGVPLPETSKGGEKMPYVAKIEPVDECPAPTEAEANQLAAEATQIAAFLQGKGGFVSKVKKAVQVVKTVAANTKKSS